MKLLRDLAPIFCILAAAIANADEKTATSPEGNAKKPREGVVPFYETAQQIKAMKPCEATVESTHGCYAVFKTADGKEFTIGSPGNTAELNHFIGYLKEGQTYKLPNAFLIYQKKHQ